MKHTPDTGFDGIDLLPDGHIAALGLEDGSARDREGFGIGCGLDVEGHAVVERRQAAAAVVGRFSTKSTQEDLCVNCHPSPCSEFDAGLTVARTPQKSSPGACGAGAWPIESIVI